MQVAYDAVAEHKITKPEVGHLAKAGVKPMRHVEEFRLVAPADGITVGQKLSILKCSRKATTSIFEERPSVRVSKVPSRDMVLPEV